MRILATFLALSFLTMTTMVPTGTSDDIDAMHVEGHQPPTGSITTPPADDHVCIDTTLLTTAGAAVPVLAGTDAFVLSVDSAEQEYNFQRAVDVNGTIVFEDDPVNITTVKGSVVGGAGGFALTVSEMGIDGLISIAENRTWDFAATGTPGCADANLLTNVPVFTPPTGISIASTSNIAVFVVVKSDFYSGHSCYSCVASSIYNRMDNTYWSQFFQPMSRYLTLASTSSSTDTYLGLTGSSISSMHYNFGTYMNTRSDKANWDQATAMGITSPGGGDGYGNLPGRYTVMFTGHSGLSTYSSYWYQYMGNLMSHEAGHDFDGKHPFGDYYFTYRDSCFGVVYEPSQNDLCIGYSDNCQGTTLPLTDSQGRPWCIGSSPPHAEKNYYVMAGNGYIDPSNDVYWVSVFKSSSKSDINSCWSTWHSFNYGPSDQSC